MEKIGISAVELVFGVWAFRDSTAATYRAANPLVAESSDKSPFREAIRSHITWLIALFMLCYVGVEVGMGGWIVDFMLRVRHGEEFASGLVAMGFWLGLAFGRFILGFVTGRIGEKFAISVYLLITMGSQLCFWLIPNFISSAVFAACVGFFLGPLFPAAVVVATKLLPQRLHVSAIGFASAFGGSGKLHSVRFSITY